MAELRRLNDYFPPQRGKFWFAAGISFTCFTLVDGIAVLAVSFGRRAGDRPARAGPDGAAPARGGRWSRSSSACSRGSPPARASFLIRAALTDNSWLLYPDVRLTGGFAFATWWKGPLAGQFVLTIGGYHPDFHRDGYPEVPRLGLSWQVSERHRDQGRRRTSR